MTQLYEPAIVRVAWQAVNVSTTPPATVNQLLFSPASIAKSVRTGHAIGKVFYRVHNFSRRQAEIRGLKIWEQYCRLFVCQEILTQNYLWPISIVCARGLWEICLEVWATELKYIYADERKRGLRKWETRELWLQTVAPVPLWKYILLVNLVAKLYILE